MNVYHKVGKMTNKFDDKAIENLKKMLISRDIHLQTKAVDAINEHLDDARKDSFAYKVLLKYFVTQDMCVHLGEASVTLDTNLLRKILYSLKNFSQTMSFYRNSCAPYITAALVRAAHVYIKEESKEKILQSILYFLIEIFSGVHRYNLTSVLSMESSYDSVQIFTLLISLTERENSTPDVLLLGSKMVHLTFSNINTSIKVNLNIINNTSNIFDKYLEALHKLLIENEAKSNKSYCSCIFGMLCHISIDVINFSRILNNCIKKTEKSESNKCNKIQSVISNMERNLSSIHDTINFIIAKIKNYDSFMDYSSYETFLQFLDSFLHEPLLHHIIPTFAKHLVINDFLVFLPRLRAASKNCNIRRLCQINLAELLVILSYEEFDLSKWKGGKSSFKNHIYEGLLNYEDDINAWPQKLFDNSATDVTLDALIVFIYFNCMNTESSQHIAQMLLRHIVYYILMMPTDTKHPFLIIKCVWLIISMANTPDADVSKINGGRLSIEKANYKLSTFILEDMEIVYTHHISIIRWTYSSASIPFSMQYKVLTMWLEREQSIPEDLLPLAAIWWSLVEIIRREIKSVLSIATDILKICIAQNCDDENAMKIKDILWDTLISTIINYIEEKDDDDDNDEALVCILELCSMYIPSKPDQIIVQKSAFLLVTIFPMLKKNNEKLLYFVFAEVFCLLTVSLKEENTIVLSQFIHSKTLLELTYDAVKFSNYATSCLACKILSYLNYYCNFYNLECESSIIIDPFFIIEILEVEKQEEKCLALLQLLYTSLKVMTKTHTDSNFKILLSLPVNFNSAIIVNSFCSIFFRLQMMCCKESKMQSESAWLCLSSMLEYTALTENHIVFGKITLQPWTCMLIRFTLSQNAPWKVHLNFLQFVYTWLRCIAILKDKHSEAFNFSNSFITNKHNTITKSLNSLIVTFDNEDIKLKLDDPKKDVVLDILKLIKTF